MSKSNLMSDLHQQLDEHRCLLKALDLERAVLVEEIEAMEDAVFSEQSAAAAAEYRRAGQVDPVRLIPVVACHLSRVRELVDHGVDEPSDWLLPVGDLESVLDREYDETHLPPWRAQALEIGCLNVLSTSPGALAQQLRHSCPYRLQLTVVGLAYDRDFPEIPRVIENPQDNPAYEVAGQAASLRLRDVLEPGRIKLTKKFPGEGLVHLVRRVVQAPHIVERRRPMRLNDDSTLTCKVLLKELQLPLDVTIDNHQVLAAEPTGHAAGRQVDVDLVAVLNGTETLESPPLVPCR